MNEHPHSAAPPAGQPVPLPPAPRYRLWLLGLALVGLIGASFDALDLQWAELLAPASRATMRDFIASFFPPETHAAFLHKAGIAALETLAISLLGTALAAILGLVLAIPASRYGNLATGLTHDGTRLLLNILRAVPELVWAVLLLIAAGLGPMAGTLALALHTAGVLGRLFAESIENAAPEPAEALRRHGVGPARVLFWATLPQILPQLLSYTLYRWENNIRAAAVLGIVGAGGLGQMLSYHLGLFHMRETCTVLLAMLLLVAVVDGASFALRRHLR